MNEKDIDNLFREKLESPSELPKGVVWNKDEAWNRFSSHRNRIHLPTITLLAAASIALIIGTGLFFYINNKSQITCMSSSSDETVKEILLKGGHKCYLASGSKIQYCYSRKSDNADTLYLNGLAYLETAPSRELVVIAKNTITNCKAAKANIKAGNDDKTTVITSLSGKITSKCSESDFPEMDVQPNERCIIYADGIFAAKEPNTDPNTLAWKTGLLTFENTPLTYAIQTIEDYYGVNIEVRSADLRYCNFTSNFKHSGIDEVIGNIQQSFNAKAEKNKNEIVFEGGECCETE